MTRLSSRDSVQVWLDFYNDIPEILFHIIPGVTLTDPGSGDRLIVDPERVYQFLNNQSADTMNKFYESWSKKEKKGKNTKIRWLSKVINLDIFKMMQKYSNAFELPASDDVYSYKKGKKTADCAELFVNMKSIVALDIKDFYYAITGKMVEELYYDYFMSKNNYNESTPSDIVRIKCLAKILSMLFMAKDIRPADIRFNDDTVLLQGTPHAGMIANAVLYKLDLELKDICNRHDLVYARYSDNFYIGCKDSIIDQEFIDQLISTIEAFQIGGIANFKIKKEKIKVMNYYTHQRVLGIVVNNKLNISTYTEDIINSKIARYSKYLNELYIKFIDEMNETTIPLTEKQILKRNVKIRKDLRELKGMVSYLGSFNRDKYAKYNTYIDFLESRANIMFRITKQTSSIYPYMRNSSERTLRSDAIRINGTLVEGSTDANMLSSFVIMESTNPEICSRFAELFSNGFMGMEYIHMSGRKILIIPTYVPSKYLTTLDELMIDVVISTSIDSFIPVSQVLAHNVSSPLYRCKKEIIKLLGYPDTHLIERECALSSIKVYNRENPSGLVDFENYQMHLRGILDSEFNVCIVKNNLDSPDIMYSNLWKLRKLIIKKEVLLLTK